MALNEKPWWVRLDAGPHKCGVSSGEGFNDRIDEFVRVALDYYGEKGLLDPTPLPKTAPQQSALAAASPLRYPGKVAVDPTGQSEQVGRGEGHHTTGMDGPGG